MQSSFNLKISNLVEYLGRYRNPIYQGQRIQRLTKLTSEASSSASRELPPRPYRRLRRLESDKVVQLVESYRAGRTVHELSDEFGIHRDTVSAALERAGIDRRYHQQVPVDLDRADQLGARGLSITETAKALGIGRTTLVKARRARG